MRIPAPMLVEKWAGLCFAVLLPIALGCSGSDATGPSPGGIVVTVATTGADLDPDGYTLLLDGGAAQASAPDNTTGIIFPNVGVGTHTVMLTGLAANCTTSGQDTVTVNVEQQSTAHASFAVGCVVFGAVHVTATVSGADPDPGGYTVQVDGLPTQALPPNGGEVTIPGVAPGTVSVGISGARANCTAAGPTQVTVTSGATASIAYAITCVQFMPTGSAIAFNGIYGNAEVALVTASSLPMDLTNNAAVDAGPVWSPDGSRIAFVSSRDGNGEIYVMNPDGSGQHNLTNNPGSDGAPAWSPDGSKIAFVSDRDGNTEVYVMSADGTGQVNLSANSAADDTPAWAPDGRTLAFVSSRDGNSEIYRMNADGSQPVNLSNNAAADVGPVWSPDGSRIAFVSGRDGNNEIYLMNADGTGQVDLSKTAGADTSPAWSPDGRQIVFVSGGVALINADGSGFTSLATSGGRGTPSRPAWSPDGSTIAFGWQHAGSCHVNGCPSSGVSVIKPDGSLKVDLVGGLGTGRGSPAWKPR